MAAGEKVIISFEAIDKNVAKTLKTIAAASSLTEGGIKKMKKQLGVATAAKGISQGLNTYLDQAKTLNEQYLSGKISTDKYTEGLQKLSKTTKNFSAYSEKLSKISNKYGLQTRISTTGLFRQKQVEEKGYVIRGKFYAISKKVTEGQKTFRMEMLSLMFAGQNVAKMFGSMTQGALDWLGISDNLTLALNVIALEGLIPYTDSIYSGIDALYGLKDSTKEAMGQLMLFGQIGGTAITTVSMLVLTLSSLASTMPLLRVPIAAATGALLGKFAPAILSTFAAVGGAPKELTDLFDSLSSISDYTGVAGAAIAVGLTLNPADLAAIVATITGTQAAISVAAKDGTAGGISSILSKIPTTAWITLGLILGAGLTIKGIFDGNAIDTAIGNALLGISVFKGLTWLGLASTPAALMTIPFLIFFDLSVAFAKAAVEDKELVDQLAKTDQTVKNMQANAERGIIPSMPLGPFQNAQTSVIALDDSMKNAGYTYDRFGSIIMENNQSIDTRTALTKAGYQDWFINTIGRDGVNMFSTWGATAQTNISKIDTGLNANKDSYKSAQTTGTTSFDTINESLNTTITRITTISNELKSLNGTSATVTIYEQRVTSNKGIFGLGGVLGIFQHGGVVPGKYGEPMPAVVHGGERFAGLHGEEPNPTPNIIFPMDALMKIFEKMMFNPPTMQYGGVVPGKFGEPTPIIAHGGERFEGIHEGGGENIINFSPIYYITVSDKKEMESMLKANNNSMIAELKRMVR
jgi:hypothetical protein